jgi:hypothetical protein
LGLGTGAKGVMVNEGKGVEGAVEVLSESWVEMLSASTAS